jgi:hypothetical protein
MSAAQDVPTQQGGKSWFLWAMSAIYLPAVSGCLYLQSGAGMIVAILLGTIALALQFGLCSRFKQRFGIWAWFVLLASLSLMGLVFFFGYAFLLYR